MAELREHWFKPDTLELDNNCAERAMKLIALGRKKYLFMGSEKGGKSAPIACTLIDIAKLNRINELMLWCYAAKSA